MPSSGMSCHVALVRTDILEERSASIIRVTRIGELGTMLGVRFEVFTMVTMTFCISLQRVSVASYG
jgi:hypothetical protein